MTKDEALKLARTALGVQLDALLGKAGHLRNDDRRRYAENGIKAIDEALTQPEQDLVEWGVDWGPDGNSVSIIKRLAGGGIEVVGWEYAPHPSQRKPLSDEEIILIVAECASSHQHTDIHFARAIEAAHGIKELV